MHTGRCAVRGGKTEIKNIGKESGTGAYINHVEETTGKKETANIYEYRYGRRDKEGNSTDVRFRWITSIELDKKNLEEMIQAGRGRWKIENEGFNNQKNGIYGIGHLNSHDRTAMKNHYLLTQIADIIMQLYVSSDVKMCLDIMLDNGIRPDKKLYNIVLTHVGLL